MLRFTVRRLCASSSATAAAAAAAGSKGGTSGSPDKTAATAEAKPPLYMEEKRQIDNYLQEHPTEGGGAVLDAEGLPPMPEPAKPYVPPPPFPVKPRRGIETPEYYNSRSAVGHPDPLAVSLTAGRSDPEWQWLKFLCFICVISTFGTSVYGIFFPEHLKWFKDEPWSTFRY